MKHPAAALLMAACLEASVVGAQGAAFARHFELRQEAGVRTSDAHAQTLRSMLSADLEYRPHARVSLRLLARGWYDWRYAFDDDLRAASGNQGRDRAELRDAALRVGWGKTDITLGRQLVTWGRADGVRVLDLINPLDLREFIIEDHADSKVPLWMAEAKRYFGDWSAQLVVAPEHGRTRFAAPGTDFYDAYHDTALGESLPRRGAGRFGWDDPDVALQVAGRVGRVDVSLNGYRGYEHTFAVGFDVSLGPNGPSVQPLRVYRRVHAVGAGWAAPVGTWVLRGESLLALDRAFSVARPALGRALGADPSGQGLVERRNVVALVGADRTWNAAFLSAQVYVDHAGGGALPLERRPTTTLGTLLFWRDWRNGTWRGQVLSIYDFDDQTLLAEPRILYQVSDALAVSLGADIFIARDERSFTGQFQRANRLVATLRLQN